MTMAMTNRMNPILLFTVLLLSFCTTPIDASVILEKDRDALRQQIQSFKSKTETLKALHLQITRLQDEASNSVGLYNYLKSGTELIDESIVIGNNLSQVKRIEDRLEEILDDLVEDSSDEEDVSAPENIVSFQELRETFVSFEDFDTDRDQSSEVSKKIWATELDLENHAISLGRDIIHKHSQEMIEAQRLEFEVISNQKESLPCIPKDEVIDMIREAVSDYASNDIDRENYALEYSGASIVYEEDYTSETYTPRDATLPSYVWNMFGGLPQVIFGKSPIRPADYILSGGMIEVENFWAISGSKGKVTIRLSHPIHISSVSIGHASSLIADISTAPKSFSVLGYAPCSNKDCEALGFDPFGGGTLLGNFSYKADPGEKSIQVFEIESESSATSNIDSNNDIEEDIEGESEGSCGIESTPDLCSGNSSFSMQSMTSYPDDKPLISAISFEILDNYGGPFTNLYKVRVYGDL